MAVPLGEKTWVGDLLAAVRHTCCVGVCDFLGVYECVHRVVAGLYFSICLVLTGQKIKAVTVIILR